MNRNRSIIIGIVIALVGAFILYLNGSKAGSLTGVDHNQNGVRDDVEKLIDEKYHDERIKIIAREMHKGILDAIRDPQHWDSTRTLYAQQCLDALFPNESGKIGREIEAATANTKERIRAYWKANAKDNGKILRRAGIP